MSFETSKPDYQADVDMQSKMMKSMRILTDRSFQMLAMMTIYSNGIRHKSKDPLMMKYKKVDSPTEEISLFDCNSLLADLISTIEFNENGELLAVGDKGGRIVVFQREQQVSNRGKTRALRLIFNDNWIISDGSITTAQ